jgi:hypothetical protein
MMSWRIIAIAAVSPMP